MTSNTAISSTGLQGFMKWLQQDQPAIYAATAAKIAKAAPKGFSGFNGSLVQNMRLAQGRRSMRLRGYTLGGCCGSMGCSVSLSTVQAACAITPVVGCIDTSCAANTGTTCASTLTGVANIITAASSAVLSAQQQSAYDSLVSTQLSRAQSGLTPLGLSSTAAGVPVVSGSSLGVSTTSGGTLLLIGAALLALWAIA
jgi:hypothetical protein